MSAKQWVRNPNSGGEKIPEAVQCRMEERIRSYAGAHFAGQYTRLDVYFRRQFCYIDAYQEPPLSSNWPAADWPETRDEYLERLRNSPTHLCRLRYFGDEEKWGFAFYSYGGDRYELSVFPSGEFFGSPEEAFQVSADVYLA